MKHKHKHACETCGKPLSVIIGGRGQNEKLCLRCLVTTYPVLKELEKEL